MSAIRSTSRLVVALVLAVAVPVLAAAQTPPTESQLQAEIARQPQQLSAYLDLAKFYSDQHRYDDAKNVLMRAVTLLDQQRGMRVFATATPPQNPGIPSLGSPIRVGGPGELHAPRPVAYVAPIYPAIAQAANVRGTVEMELIVAGDGRVRDAHVIRSQPLLDAAALDAVRQWRYTPTLLNNVPVETTFVVSVNFPSDVSSAGAASSGAAMGMEPYRVGGGIQEPRLLKKVPPVYPSEAIAAHVSGMVFLEVVVDRDGNVSDVKVVRSSPMLDQAAVDAVRQWRYTQTLLNGVPVSLVFTVTVNFVIGG